jgi:hypothetical protein
VELTTSSSSTSSSTTGNNNNDKNNTTSAPSDSGDFSGIIGDIGGLKQAICPGHKKPYFSR